MVVVVEVKSASSACWDRLAAVGLGVWLLVAKGVAMS